MSANGSAEAQAPRDINELVAHTHLVDVVTFSTRGARREDGEADPDELIESATDEYGYRDQVLLQDADEFLNVRIRVWVNTSDAHYAVDAAAYYGKTGRFAVPSPLAQEFAERVGFFAVWPYLRAEVQRLASTLGTRRVLLGPVRQGEVKIVGPEAGGRAHGA